MSKYLMKGDGFKCRTDFLYSVPSFLSGMGTVVNLGGNYFEFNTSESSNEADRLAIANDFCLVGQDLQSAIDSVLNTYQRQLQE